jgi:hypothetical protein
MNPKNAQEKMIRKPGGEILTKISKRVNNEKT